MAASMKGWRRPSRDLNPSDQAPIKGLLMASTIRAIAKTAEAEKTAKDAADEAARIKQEEEAAMKAAKKKKGGGKGKKK